MECYCVMVALRVWLYMCVCVCVCVCCVSRAARNCDMLILSKESLDEAIGYYPNICRDIKKAAERKRAELFKASTSVQKKKEDFSRDILSRDTGCKLFHFFLS